MLGVFEQAVLLAIVRLRDEAYGRTILNDVQDRLRRDVSAGAVQATLARLEQKGLVTSRLGPGTEIRAGRPRRFYRVAADGVRALDEARDAVTSLWRGFERPRKGYA
jgi:DNA-binding PadR family transcriptional regulator